MQLINFGSMLIFGQTNCLNHTMKFKYFPDENDVVERLENLVIHAENLDFGDLDLEMEGLYFNIENQLDILGERLDEANVTSKQMDEKLLNLIDRAIRILIKKY